MNCSSRIKLPPIQIQMTLPKRVLWSFGFTRTVKILSCSLRKKNLHAFSLGVLSIFYILDLNDVKNVSRYLFLVQ
jgi:hypothetical protein